MANRYADDIRRIVGKDDLLNPLDKAKDRERINSIRSVAWYDASGSVQNSSGTSTGGEGANIPNSDGTNPTTGTPSGSSATNNNDQIPNPYDPLSWLQEPKEQDVGGLFGTNTNNSIVSGIDPNTGKEVEMYLGKYQLATDGVWPIPLDPGYVDETFQPGFWWDHLSALAPDKYQSPAIAHDAYITALNSQGNGNLYEDMGLNQISESLYQSCARQIQSGGNPIPPGATFCVDISRQTCTIADPDGPGDYCSIVPPGNDSLLLNKIQVRFNKDGEIEVNGNQNSGDTDGFLGTGFKTLTLESQDQPGKYYTIEQGVDYSTLIYEVNPADPLVPIGTNYTKIGLDGHSEAQSIDTLGAFQK